MSVVHVGAHAWSFGLNTPATISSTCGVTSASAVSVAVSHTSCSNCDALTTSMAASLQANAYGGSMSAVHVGANAWSRSATDKSSPCSSTCGATSATGVSVAVSDASCSNCSAVILSSHSFQANAYGGSMSVVYIGAVAWSTRASIGSPSSSTCEETSASGVRVNVSDTSCYNCRALSNANGLLSQANTYGGSMSVVHVGAHAWSYGIGTSISGKCGVTSASAVSVAVSDTSCSSCSALTTNAGTTSVENSHQTSACGGSMSIVRVGALAWSYGTGPSSSMCGVTSASGVSVAVRDTSCSNCKASSENARISFQSDA
jgi:hypothetical protein